MLFTYLFRAKFCSTPRVLWLALISLLWSQALRVQAQSAPSAEPGQLEDAAAPTGSAPAEPAPVQVVPAGPPASAQPIYVQPVYAEPPPPPDLKIGRKGTFLLIAGGAAFLGGYVGSAVTYAINTPNDVFSPLLLVPLAGPFIALGTTDWDRLDSLPRSLDMATLTLQGAMQVAGLTLMIVGAVQRLRSARAEAPPRFQFATAGVRGGAVSTLRLRF